jgi:hypothetical protein
VQILQWGRNNCAHVQKLRIAQQKPDAPGPSAGPNVRADS